VISPPADLILDGCTSSPLAHYLKALAVLRLVGAQADPHARGSWRQGRFVLRTTLSPDDVVRFFLDDYRPTPVVSPWNGGSGFAPKDNDAALTTIESSGGTRLDAYRRTIAVARRLFARFAGDVKVTKDAKVAMIPACRAEFPDEALPWMDAALVLAGDRVQFPPLLGTGGNDGRLDFSNNFMQRLLEVMPPREGERVEASEAWLRSSLFATAVPGLLKGKAIGQFLPGAAGGPNATAGYDADSLVNPWDFVLLIEGTVLFAAAAVRRMDHRGQRAGMASPFTVRPSGIGYASASASEDDTSRGEIWLPTWPAPASPSEVTALFSEGRAEVGRRRARSGVDFARAVAAFGVDRGLDGFERFGFHVRNGLAYFATHLDRLPVRRNPNADLLDEVDSWIESVRSKARGSTTPASVARSLRELDRSSMVLCRDGSPLRVQDVLVALGSLERALVRSRRWTQDDRGGVRPLVGLSEAWVRAGDDGSHEWSLALALASVGRPGGASLRDHLEPVDAHAAADGRRWARWAQDPSRAVEVVWSGGDPIDDLVAVLERWLLRAERDGSPSGGLTGLRGASLAAVGAFLDARTDDARIASLLWGLIAIDPPHSTTVARTAAPPPDAGYAILKLCAAGTTVRQRIVPLDRSIFRRAASGDLAEATRRAARRLRACDLPTALDVVTSSPSLARRRLAAVLFPLAAGAIEALANYVLRPTTASSS